MIIDYTSQQELIAHIDKTVLALQERIGAVMPTDETDKDNAQIWWTRGQIKALRVLKEAINTKED